MAVIHEAPVWARDFIAEQRAEFLNRKGREMRPEDVAFHARYEAGDVDVDEPPGMSERSYQLWLALGGVVKAEPVPNPECAKVPRVSAASLNRAEVSAVWSAKALADHAAGVSEVSAEGVAGALACIVTYTVLAWQRYCNLVADGKATPFDASGAYNRFTGALALSATGAVNATKKRK